MVGWKVFISASASKGKRSAMAVAIFGTWCVEISVENLVHGVCSKRCAPNVLAARLGGELKQFDG